MQERIAYAAAFYCMLPYRYDLGFTANGVALPDPSQASFDYEDLDLSGERDTAGLLHRDYVATKLKWAISYDALDWSVATQILAALESEFFQFTCPNPKTLTGTYSNEFYVGARRGDIKWVVDGDRTGDEAIISLSFDIIER